MKEGQEKTGVFTLRSLLEKQNRTKLAVVLGAAAMILLLLSELLPTNAVKAPVLAPADETAYREQLEEQLQELIEQIDGAGEMALMKMLLLLSASQRPVSSGAVLQRSGLRKGPAAPAQAL